MLKEIYEQPKAITDTLTSTSTSARKIVDSLGVENVEMVYFTGSGTSYHACLAANFALASLTRIFSTNIQASEFSSWVKTDPRPGALVVAVSQSGESADVLAAVRAATESKMHTIGVTNTAQSSLTHSTEFQLVSTAGEENAVTATKSYTATMAAAYALVLELARVVPSMAGGYDSLLVALRKAPDLVKDAIQLCDGVSRELASKFLDKEFYFMLGSGPNYSTALEGALKLKESCNVYAEGFATREFLHGPIQLVDSRTPVVILRGTEDAERVSALETSFLGFGAPTVVVKQKSDISTTKSTYVVELPAISEEVFSPLVYVIPLQLYAYYLSLQRGLNPDRPGKLTKVVR
jgi:glucosamine--fructose-6-phosphate aminotransferase (isomerizing)